MKNQKGITLIALVITIIVLLILAGVSIAMLTGENGILTQATGTKKDTLRATAAEKIDLALNASYSKLLQGKLPVEADLAGVTNNTSADEGTYTATIANSLTADTIVTITWTPTDTTKNGAAITGSITYDDSTSEKYVMDAAANHK